MFAEHSTDSPCQSPSEPGVDNQNLLSNFKPLRTNSVAELRPSPRRIVREVQRRGASKLSSFQDITAIEMEIRDRSERE